MLTTQRPHHSRSHARRHARRALLLLAPLFVLNACGANDDGAGGAAGGEEVARSAQAFAPTPNDLPPAAAAVARVVNGNTELWVFACGADHRMRRRVQGPTGSWTSWFIVANSFPCYSAPTIGKWIGGATETLGVYYRGGNVNLSPDTQDRLIEAWYDSSGTNSATDLSNRADFGTIKGTPAVVDAVDVPGMSQRIAVAVKRANDEVATFDYYQGSWHAQAATLSDGTTALAAAADDFAVSYRQYAKNYFSIELADHRYVVFTRSTWTAGYREYTTFDRDDFEGVATFGRPDAACVDFGCLMLRRRSDFRLFWRSLAPNTNVESPYFDNIVVSGSAYSAPTGDNTFSAFATAGRNISDSLDVFDFVHGTFGTVQTASVYSGAALVVNGASSGRTGAVLFAARDAGDPTDFRRLKLLRLDDVNGGTPREMNYPGGLLAR